jgi:hypothetical protein
MEMIEDLDGEMIGDFDEERCQLYIYVNWIFVFWNLRMLMDVYTPKLGFSDHF